jgi:hypothetical protein
MKTEVVPITPLSAALTRSLFPTFELFSRIGRNMMAVSASFARLAQPLVASPKQSIVAALHSQDIEVASHRPMTEWEREDIAERVAAKLSRSRRPRGRVFDVESLELEGVADEAVPTENPRNAQHEGAQRPRGPRKLAEPPTELTLRAQELLRTIGRGKYSAKLTVVVEEMIRATRAGELGETFKDEKARLRKWLNGELHTRSRRSSSAQKKMRVVPLASTLHNNINSLEPIYQNLVAELRPNFGAKSGAI